MRGGRFWFLVPDDREGSRPFWIVARRQVSGAHSSYTIKRFARICSTVSLSIPVVTRKCVVQINLLFGPMTVELARP